MHRLAPRARHGAGPATVAVIKGGVVFARRAHPLSVHGGPDKAVHADALEEGDLGAGDSIEVRQRPDHGVTCRTVFDAILRDPTLIPLAVSARQLPADLRSWLAQRVAG